MRYVLGLDIGIASVGWAVLELDSFDEPFKIIDLNSRIFTKAENPQDGSSLAKPRREARGNRRRLRRRRHRLDRIKHLIYVVGLMSKEGYDKLYTSGFDKDVYTLRAEGLDRSLSAAEWTRVLIHIAKHRGFKSNRKSTTVAGEDGKVLQAVKENQEILSKYRTVGEMFHNDDKFKSRKRNTTDSYILCVSRHMLKAEIKELFTAQRSFNNPFTDEKFEAKYIEIFEAQRAFDEGPGSESPYGGNQIEKMIGQCTFEDGEKRAPKASYSFMRFNLLQKVNHIRIESSSATRALSEEERSIIIALAYKSPNFTYGSIRKAIKLPYDMTFSDVYYKYEKGLSEEELIDKNEKSNKIKSLEPYHTIRKALDKVYKNRIEELSEDNINDIAYAFSVYKTDAKIVQKLKECGITDQDIEALVNNLGTFAKFGHLSVKACKKINKYLEKGMNYDKACEAAGYDFKGHCGEKTEFLSGAAEEIKEIPNPVVKRAMSQTIKVINAVVRKYGSPVEVHVELAREMARSKKDRDKINSIMKDNQAANDRIRGILKNEFNINNPTGIDILKYRLYQEQQGICVYSQKVMDLERVMKDGKYAEIDHILPYSRSFDDSYNNKVLVKTEENRLKRNRTPYEYMQDNEVKYKGFCEIVKSIIHNPTKVSNLLRENYSPQLVKDWKARNINDTRYISKFVYNFLNDHLLLADGMRKRRIIAVNGAVTGYIRKRLGINKIRANGDTHHAVDAVVIACVTQGVISKVTKYSQWQEVFYKNNNTGILVDYETGEIITKDNFDEFIDSKFPEPWPLFRKELEARAGTNPKYEIECLRLDTYSPEEVTSLRPMFVSRMPNRKVTGQAHQETIRSSRMANDGMTVSKVPLTSLKLSKDGQSIEGYFSPESDRLLYEALLNRLQGFGGKADKAFTEPFYKPKNDGSKGPIVKAVKITAPSTLNVRINNGKGLADNGSMVRIDVFHITAGKGAGYYLVPIYVADTKKDKLPSKAIVAHKKYDEWKLMDEKDFVFSLYPNDLIYVEKKGNIELSLDKKIEKDSTLPKKISSPQGYFYYVKAGIGDGSVQIKSHDGVYLLPSMGVKTLKLLRKCVVDELGNISFVGKEKRQHF